MMGIVKKKRRFNYPLYYDYKFVLRYFGEYNKYGIYYKYRILILIQDLRIRMGSLSIHESYKPRISYSWSYILLDYDRKKHKLDVHTNYVFSDFVYYVY